MTDITNHDRAEWAEAALDTFVAQTGHDKTDVDAVGDLIADLGHYADAHDMDFLSLIRSGIGHWSAETYDPQDPNRIDVFPDITITVDPIEIADSEEDNP